MHDREERLAGLPELKRLAAQQRVDVIAAQAALGAANLDDPRFGTLADDLVRLDLRYRMTRNEVEETEHQYGS